MSRPHISEHSDPGRVCSSAHAFNPAWGGDPGGGRQRLGVGASLAGLCWGQAVQGVPAGSPSPKDPMGGEAPRTGQLGLAFYHHSRQTPLLSEHAVSLGSSGGCRKGKCARWEGQCRQSSGPLRVRGVGRGHITLDVRAGSQAPLAPGWAFKEAAAWGWVPLLFLTKLGPGPRTWGPCRGVSPAGKPSGRCDGDPDSQRRACFYL